MSLVNLEVTTTGINDVTAYLDALSNAVEDMTIPLERIKKDVLASIQKNFDVGGRPGWAPYSRFTNYHSDQMLVKSGRMRAEIDGVVSNNQLTIQAENEKAAWHQKGVPSRNLPARPFVMFQPDDIQKAVDTIQKYIQNVTQPRTTAGTFATGYKFVSSGTPLWGRAKGGGTRVVQGGRWRKT